MIAKAKSIAHGSISIDYITRLGEAEIICINNLPKDVEPSTWYYQMMLHQKTSHCLARGRPLKNSIIRIEISPSREESVNFTHRDWEKLVWDTLMTMDAIKLSRKARRNLASQTNLANSQFVATIHRDSKSGIVHIHIDVNRVDINGNINDDSFIGRRATMAANEVARQRGWIQAEEKSIKNKTKITMDCYNVLQNMRSFNWAAYQSALAAKGYDVQIKRDHTNQVRGYTIRMGNSIYKASDLGKGRNLTASRIEATWRRLHNKEAAITSQEPWQRPHRPTWQAATPQSTTLPRIVRDEPKLYHRVINAEGRDYKIDVPDKAMSAMTDEIASFQESAETADCITDVALLLFANYLDAATSVAESGGGGGGSPSSDWGRKRNEDDEEWLRRCARMSHQMVTTPKYKRGRGR